MAFIRVRVHPENLRAHGWQLVGFLPDAAVDAFALHGSFAAVREQLQAILGSGLPIEVVVPHPVPTPAPGSFDYARAFAEQVIAKL